MKKISLSVPDRIQLPLIYPQSGGLIEMEVVKSLQEKIRFTPAEIDEYELKDLPGGKIVWNTSKEKDREYVLEDSEIKVLQKGIDQLDKEGKITLTMVDLARRIMNINKDKK